MLQSRCKRNASDGRRVRGGSTPRGWRLAEEPRPVWIDADRDLVMGLLMGWEDGRRLLNGLLLPLIAPSSFALPAPSVEIEARHGARGNDPGKGSRKREAMKKKKKRQEKETESQSQKQKKVRKRNKTTPKGKNPNIKERQKKRKEKKKSRCV